MLFFKSGDTYNRIRISDTCMFYYKNNVMCNISYHTIAMPILPLSNRHEIIEIYNDTYISWKRLEHFKINVILNLIMSTTNVFPQVTTLYIFSRCYLRRLSPRAENNQSLSR